MNQLFLALALVVCFCGASFAQCANGVCQKPSRPVAEKFSDYRVDVLVDRGGVVTPAPVRSAVATTANVAVGVTGNVVSGVVHKTQAVAQKACCATKRVVGFVRRGRACR